MADPVTTASTTPAPAAPATPLAAAIKDGPRTTEFWFTLASTLLSGAFAVGLVGGGTVGQMAGLGAFVLTQAGYAVSRGLAKGGAS